MYKFFGEPLREIKSKTSGRTVFRFDTKGEFITDDEEIIRRALGYFDYIQLEATEIGGKVEKTVHDPPILITTRKEFKCKECGFICGNQGELLAHYRTHKKGE
jgi:hypothetical protein